MQVLESDHWIFTEYNIFDRLIRNFRL